MGPLCHECGALLEDDGVCPTEAFHGSRLFYADWSPPIPEFSEDDEDPVTVEGE